MGDQGVAAYDPIFWFFHANWDRLWWKWQRNARATDLQSFLSVVTDDSSWLTSSPFNQLPPFSETADQTVNLVAQFDVDYAGPPGDKPSIPKVRSLGSTFARTRSFVPHSEQVSVRVKGIDRLNIPGSFLVHLRSDGETIARKAFFQSRRPRECGNCRKQGVVNFDFLVNRHALRGRKVDVAIELVRKDRTTPWFPLTNAGDPTINARLLLQNE